MSDDRSSYAVGPYQITFLLDKSNNWIENYLRRAEKFVNNAQFAFEISHDHLKVDQRDVVFILGYTRILDKTFLRRNKLNLVVHESDLPLGKGFAPTQWQVLAGKDEIPICLIEAAEVVDSGDIVFKSSFHLTGYELYDEIRLKQAQATFRLMDDFLTLYPKVIRTTQIGEESFYPRRGPQDSELDIDSSIREQFDLMRIANNEAWPCYFYVDGHKYLLKIFKSDAP